MIIPIHHVQGDRRSAESEVGNLLGCVECGNVGMWECGNVGMWECGNGDDDRHRQHDRRVLISYYHCFVSKYYECFHCLTNAVTIEVSGQETFLQYAVQENI